MPSFPSLGESTTADVCVVGAGIAGLTTAYLLARAGRSVVVLDGRVIGGGETERTTAHLSAALDAGYARIEKLHGAETARLAAQSHIAAIDQVEKIAKKEGIDCGFTRLEGYLFVPPGEPTTILDAEMEACRRAGMMDVERVPRTPLRSFDTGLCLRFPRQATIQPLLYLRGLAQAITRDGGRIYTGTRVVRVEGGSKARVTSSEGHSVDARSIVVATHAPVNDFVVMHTKQAAYRTYVLGGRIPCGSVAEALYWDTADPYHYVRIESAARMLPQATSDVPSAGSDMLLVGGEDHRTGQESDPVARFVRLEAWARERFPMLKAIEFRWSGQILEPVDSLAFIGVNPLDDKNVFIATGSSGNGMTYGTIAGMLITDLILERKNPWAPIYDPARITLAAARVFAEENFNTAVMYTEWLTGGDVRSASEIPPGSGAVERRGLKKIAIYRDELGALHECSAFCTHLGGVVAWNSAERSWDCPCHGSRFDPFGRVINGPAISDLTAVHGDSTVSAAAATEVKAETV